MSVPELSEPVRALLRRIESYEQLEVVLALAHEPSRAWPLAVVLERSRLSEELAQEALEQLVSAGLLTRASPEEGWRLADPELQRLAPQLLAAYRDNVVGVIRELTENALERVRTAALRTFADAFVVRRGNS